MSTEKHYDLSNVPEHLRAQFGADMLAARRHAASEEEASAYINGMLRAYEVMANHPAPVGKGH